MGSILALAGMVLISTVVPLVLVIWLFMKEEKNRKGIVVSLLVGIIIYVAMEWGIKEHGLAWLFNHTDFLRFMNAHYIPYLLIVSLVGAILAMIPMNIYLFAGKNKLQFSGLVVFGLGYTMAESFLLMGLRSMNTLIALIKKVEGVEPVSVDGLVLSCYERILMTVIQVSLFVLLAYMIKKKKLCAGIVITGILHTLTTFLPAFFLAFTTTDYLELYDRNVGLFIVYVVLTVGAVAAGAALYSLKEQYEKY